ncbi:MaoC family dehydratase N-terminal domain-containing protein [Phenylobacterium sp.]|uniref:FAS1-like dehydratase domain-containing protein n=1 Tax=Phenylobacterium sp. TaxID=1871053 RepID=UPI0025E1E71D|nr:MaoC family dehydratase N-terminal domain-containing protein [Phenylobacterium sp.]MBX3484032.1 MaoC family dehydratase N-terminal domain-containing protein [Phenylobacterium sp.]
MAAKTFPIEAGHIMMFARSVGDPNPVYYDAEAAKKTEAGGVIAPPTFVQSSAQFDPDYFLRPKIGQPWFGSGKNPTGITRAPGGGGGGGGGGLHAEQHYEYHRPLKAGDVLTATTFPGKTWEKEGKRSGKLVFSESVTEYRDQNGELVVTARGVGVRTERPVEQPAPPATGKKEEA